MLDIFDETKLSKVGLYSGPVIIKSEDGKYEYLDINNIDRLYPAKAQLRKYKNGQIKVVISNTNTILDLLKFTEDIVFEKIYEFCVNN